MNEGPQKKMRILKFLSIPIFLLAVFSYGFFVGKYNWFPYESLRSLKHTVTGVSSPSMEDAAPTFNVISGLENKLSIQDIKNLRNNISRYIIPTNQSDISVTNENGNNIISTTYYGIISRGYLISPSENQNNCLRIYVQGHGGSPPKFDYYNQIIDIFSNEGCDVLSLSMIGLGFNEGPASFPSRFGKVSLSLEQAKIHGNYSFFFDIDNPNLDPLSLFLHPHMQIIKYVKDQGDYKNISILGISGGGWYTVWLAALLPELNTSLSYAGSFPLAYRKGTSIHGDWEQIYSNLYSKFSYLELYQLMLANEDGKRTRKSFLIYNDRDDCCFMDPSATNFKDLVDGLDFYPKVIVDLNNKHSMNVNLVSSLLKRD
ncbi:hypothetical protein OAD39_01480 [Gammaproteobacteria bacterium]|nr:hypothetical protein [Gammaproteobacteria bacterium]